MDFFWNISVLFDDRFDLSIWSLRIKKLLVYIVAFSQVFRLRVKIKKKSPPQNSITFFNEMFVQ